MAPSKTFYLIFEINKTVDILKSISTLLTSSDLKTLSISWDNLFKQIFCSCYSPFMTFPRRLIVLPTVCFLVLLSLYTFLLIFDINYAASMHCSLDISPFLLSFLTQALISSSFTFSYTVSSLIISILFTTKK
jgi:hypothetical protein